jgi:hypothetical protein
MIISSLVERKTEQLLPGFCLGEYPRAGYSDRFSLRCSQGGTTRNAREGTEYTTHLKFKLSKRAKLQKFYIYCHGWEDTVEFQDAHGNVVMVPHADWSSQFVFAGDTEYIMSINFT